MAKHTLALTQLLRVIDCPPPAEDLESPRSLWSQQTTAGAACSPASEGQGSSAADLPLGDDVEAEGNDRPPSDGQGFRVADLTLGDGADAEDCPSRALEVRNTFLTIVDDNDAPIPLRRTVSSPVQFCYP
ncbi:unnamed protein product [Prorocentrum cordatum]|uniref:Uncharacterized protein n=1 Tax=Prorocentrum cordatum TaxID=2364126 RepID=A0ABN9RI29_9DINO|nr:unnamed protein product [Polarella glacialis]